MNYQQSNFSTFSKKEKTALSKALRLQLSMDIQYFGESISPDTPFKEVSKLAKSILISARLLNDISHA